MNTAFKDMNPLKNENLEIQMTSSETSQDIPKETPKNIPNEEAKEIPAKISDNTSKENSNDTPKLVKQKETIIDKENNEKGSDKRCENEINTREEIQEDKESTNASLNVISLKQKEEKEEINNKHETQDNVIKKKDNSSDIDDLSFPIVNPKKILDATNPDYNSLSLLNNALSQSQLNLYYMNLKIPENLEQKNKFSPPIPPSDSTPIFNPLQNTIPNFFLENNPQSLNFFWRKYHRNSNLIHFVPVTFSCSCDTQNVGKSRIKYIQKEKEFFEKIIKIGDVSNITEFWDIFQHMKKPSQCPVGTDYHLFKRGIIPMWEDKMNKDGGKLSVLLTWKYASLIWEEVAFNFSRGLLPYYENINGIVISMRAKFIVLSFWVKIKTTHLVEKIRYALSSMLQTPSTNCIDFIAFN
jgi:hypothetical protein